MNTSVFFIIWDKQSKKTDIIKILKPKGGGMSNFTLEKKAATKNGIIRMILVVLSFLLHTLFILFLIMVLYSYWPVFSAFFGVLGFVMVLVIYGQHKTASIKMPWILFILLVPVAGLSLYLLVGLDRGTKKMKKRYEDIDQVLLPLLPRNNEEQERLKADYPYVSNVTYYIKNNTRYPVYQNSDITYYDDGKKGLEAQKEELKKARHFIFMEYHAIQEAAAWGEIQDILEEKVKEGVEVRVFYDDMGSIGFVNTDFVKRLRAKGIRARVFNPFAPGVNLFLNNRDHRKITVIDGKVGFTGGYNLADEYFHIVEPYGFWKDTGIKIEGEAVRSLTVTFLEMWNAIKGNDLDDNDFDRYLPRIEYRSRENGYVCPYADSPMDDIHVGEDVYMSIAESAKDYVWFVTPYLIITEETEHILSLAAQRGVDVRIITPGVPDKKMIYSVTRSYYNGLVRNGVRIYEYTPGFTHAKMCISDDNVATCGTINLDYRSLYHHFENGCLFSGCNAVSDIKADFESMFKASREVTDYYKAGRGAFLRFEQMLLRLIAPLL